MHERCEHEQTDPSTGEVVCTLNGRAPCSANACTTREEVKDGDGDC